MILETRGDGRMGSNVANHSDRFLDAEKDSFDFRTSWEAVRRACAGHKKVIFVTCLVTVGLVVAYVRIWPPIYAAEVVLIGDSGKDMSRESFYGGWSVFRNDPLTDEAQLLISGPVVSEVIHRLQLRDDEVYHTFFGYIGYASVKSTIGKKYRAIKEWFFPREHGPFDPTEGEVEAAQTRMDFKSGVSFERMMETNLGTLSVRGPTPRVGQIANTMVDVYLEQRRQRHVAEADTAARALAVELNKAQEGLTRLS